MSLAQIGEFAFVLLSRASNLHLIEVVTDLCSVIIFRRMMHPYNNIYTFHMHKQCHMYAISSGHMMK